MTDSTKRFFAGFRSEGLAKRAGSEQVHLEKFALINMNRNRRMVRLDEAATPGVVARECSCSEKIDSVQRSISGMQRDMRSI